MRTLFALIAVGLDAARIAFSQSKIEKKAVSAVAAAVVGIGLFMAPIESAEAETKDVLTYSRISGVHVHCWNGVIYYISVGFHVFDTSSAYEVVSNFPSFPFGREEDGFNDSAYYLAQYRELNFSFGDFILIGFRNRQ